MYGLCCKNNLTLPCKSTYKNTYCKSNRRNDLKVCCRSLPKCMLQERPDMYAARAIYRICCKRYLQECCKSDLQECCGSKKYVARVNYRNTHYRSMAEMCCCKSGLKLITAGVWLKRIVARGWLKRIAAGAWL